jgi:hypothetical protein
MYAGEHLCVFRSLIGTVRIEMAGSARMPPRPAPWYPLYAHNQFRSHTAHRGMLASTRSGGCLSPSEIT